MLYDTSMFSPASAVEGYTANSQLTNVPYFQTKVGDGITTFWHRAVSEAPSGISSDVNVGSSGYYYWYMYDGSTNIAITDVTSSKTVVGMGYSANINVTAISQGNTTETFNVTVYANTTIIASENVTLSAGSSATVTFTWNTTGWPIYQNCTISAYAWPVPGETDTTDNTWTDGIITIVIGGDVNADGTVDVKDVYKVALAYGTSLEGPNPPGRTYNPNCDINGDGKIDVKDYYIVCKHYGETAP
jgi:hypothetical protein